MAIPHYDFFFFGFLFSVIHINVRRVQGFIQVLHYFSFLSMQSPQEISSSSMDLKTIYIPVISTVDPIYSYPRLLYSTSCLIFLFEMINISQLTRSRYNSCYSPTPTCFIPYSFLLLKTLQAYTHLLQKKKIFVSFSFLSLNLISNSLVNFTNSISK